MVLQMKRQATSHSQTTSHYFSSLEEFPIKLVLQRDGELKAESALLEGVEEIWG